MATPGAPTLTVETKYVCRKCDAVDHDRGLSGLPPVVLTCYSCGAGRNMPVDEMIHRGEGMFPERSH